jgi:hypothetical protein
MFFLFVYVRDIMMKLLLATLQIWRTFRVDCPWSLSRLKNRLVDWGQHFGKQSISSKVYCLIMLILYDFFEAEKLNFNSFKWFHIDCCLCVRPILLFGVIYYCVWIEIIDLGELIYNVAVKLGFIGVEFFDWHLLGQRWNFGNFSLKGTL